MARKLDFDLASPADLAALKRALLPEPRVVATQADTPTFADEHQQIVSTNALLTTITTPLAAAEPRIVPGWSTKIIARGAAGVAVAAGAGDSVVGALGIAQNKAATLTLLTEAAGVRTWLLDGQNA